MTIFTQMYLFACFIMAIWIVVNVLWKWKPKGFEEIKSELYSWWISTTPINPFNIDPLMFILRSFLVMPCIFAGILYVIVLFIIGG